MLRARERERDTPPAWAQLKRKCQKIKAGSRFPLTRRERGKQDTRSVLPNAAGSRSRAELSSHPLPALTQWVAPTFQPGCVCAVAPVSPLLDRLSKMKAFRVG